MIHYLEHPSPLGTLLLAATERGVSGIYFEQHRHFAGNKGWQAAPGHELLLRAGRELDEYFAGERRTFDLPLDPEGTPFQREVWLGLTRIPWGETRDYGELARAIAHPRAVRAVGAANGRNPLSIVVPCHRVIGKSGDLVGYAGGLERKRYLLTLEQVLPPLLI